VAVLRLLGKHFKLV
jgi:hypothetical protein